MKKIGVFVLALIFLSLFVIHSNNTVVASTTNLEGQVNNLNENLENIPKTPEEIRDRYLRQEWNKIIAKTAFLGPIHNFFIANPIIFKILIMEPYSFSITFFSILFLWCLIILWIKNIFKPLFKQSWKAWLIGLGIAMVLAWVTAIKRIVLAIFDIIFAQDKWWIRLILWLAVLVGIILFS